VDGFPYRRSNGQTIYLIDTPGFDDSNKGNINVLEDIASKLCTFYDSDLVRIVGIIYFQRISDVRMAGSSLTSLRIFEKICGAACFPQITIATSFWSLLHDDQLSIGEEREKTLRDDDTFFGNLVKGKARMRRYLDSFTSARTLVEEFFENERVVVLAIQKEMVDERMTLAETSVGRYLEGDLLAVREKYERALEDLGREYEEAIAEEQDDDLVTTISEEKKAYEECIKQSEVAQKGLLVTYEDMTRRQQEWLVQLPDSYSGATATEEKSVRETELEEQLERMEMDHFRQMNIARRDKEAELMDAYQEGYESNKRAVEENLRHERAGKEKVQYKPKRNKTLLQLLSIAFAESVDYLQCVTRAASFPLETKQPKVQYPKIDLSNARLAVWARERARKQAARREQALHASSRPSRPNESYHSQGYTTYELEQAEYYESEGSDEYTLETQSSSYQTVERYPATTRVSEREEVSVLGPKRRKHQEHPLELSRTYTPGNSWK
jgi:hypothetical protein